MPEYGYSMQVSKEGKYAKAQRYDVDASYKDLGMVCANIKNMTSERAEKFLENVADGEAAVRYYKHNKKLGHRRELGGRKGKYPKKCAKLVLEVLRNAVANAANKGLLGELVIVHAAANKQSILSRVASRGRWRKSNLETARIEVIVKETKVASEEDRKKKLDARKKKTDEKKAKKKALEEKEKALSGEGPEPEPAEKKAESAEKPKAAETPGTKPKAETKKAEVKKPEVKASEKKPEGKNGEKKGAPLASAFSRSEKPSEPVAKENKANAKQ